MVKNALITGASRGIGKAIAYELASKGYNLYLVCRSNTQLLQAIAEELQGKYHVTVKLFTGDIGTPEFVADIFSQISSLDVLVNNAGISYIGLITDMSVSDWKQITSTNLDSVFYCCQQACKLMVPAKSGKIVNISSVWGNVGASTEVAYSATKGAVNSLTKALAKELAPSNIQVNSVACGLIDTEMNSHLTKDEMAELIDSIPASRAGSPEDVASLVSSLISTTNYLTGQIITLDGAWI